MDKHRLHRLIGAGLLALGLRRVCFQLAANVDELLRPENLFLLRPSGLPLLVRGVSTTGPITSP